MTEFYESDGKAHPIRSSAGYSQEKTGEIPHKPKLLKLRKVQTTDQSQHAKDIRAAAHEAAREKTDQEQKRGQAREGVVKRAADGADALKALESESGQARAKELSTNNEFATWDAMKILAMEQRKGLFS